MLKCTSEHYEKAVAVLNVRNPCLLVCLPACLPASTDYVVAIFICCFSVDCWDGSNSEPEVYHGHTLTSHILFKDIIIAVRDHAFVTSEYPVILSLENHCSIPMQKVMAQHLQDILGDLLYTTPPDPEEKYLPSPETLKGKILIKASLCV
jgi:hypothetical protein